MYFELAMIALYVTFMAPQRLVIDVSQTSGVAPPDAHVVFSYPALHAAFDAPPIPPVLRLLVITAENPNDRKLSQMDFLVQNVSNDTVEVPIARDGKAAYDTCHGRFLESTFVWSGSKARGGNLQVGAELYGCALLKGSTIVLEHGQSFIVSGSPFAKQNGNPIPKGEFTYSLSEAKYGGEGDKTTVTIKGLYYVPSE